METLHEDLGGVGRGSDIKEGQENQDGNQIDVFR